MVQRSFASYYGLHLEAPGNIAWVDGRDVSDAYLKVVGVDGRQGVGSMVVEDSRKSLSRVLLSELWLTLPSFEEIQLHNGMEARRRDAKSFGLPGVGPCRKRHRGLVRGGSTNTKDYEKRFLSLFTGSAR